MSAPAWQQRIRNIYTNRATVPSLFTDTDDGNALRLIAASSHRFRRIADMRRWYVWDGMRWAQDFEDGEIREAAKELARRLPENDKPAKSFKHYSMAATGLSSCVRLAESDPQISIIANDLDSWPELLNTPSGIIDLRTGETLVHDPAYLLSRITAYNVGTPHHPRWDQFLWETFADGELIAYMQRLAGLAALGMVTEHILPFLHGIGANGKGVFTLVLQGLLGDTDAGGYALSAPDGFLMAGREGKHETEMARLRGARFVVCSEQTSGKRFDEQKVKRLTGGDILTGRFMRGDFFDFKPSHLIWVMSNHLPEVKEGGPSFWRRVRRIPFEHVVPENQRVDELHEILLKAEGPAILAWVIQGAVEVLAGGLQDPAIVLAATQEYELGEDTLASFVKERCLLLQHCWVPMADLREAYIGWCDEAGVDQNSRLSTKALGQRLRTEYKVTEGQIKKPVSRKTYKGIALQSNRDEDDE